MKTLKLIAIGLALLFTNVSNAQVAVNINIGTTPAWGPVGYTETRYYYLPDIETYYDVQLGRFIYYEGGWVQRAYLPVRYKNYDLYGGYKVVLTDYNGSTPYILFKEHKNKYYKGYRKDNQKTFGERPSNSNAGKDNKSNKTVERHSDPKSSPGGNAKDGGKNQGHGGGKGKGKK